MSFDVIAISDLGRVVTGKTPSTKNPAFFDGNYQFVTPSDLDWKTYYCNSTERTVTDDAKSKHLNQFIPANAILVTCIGNTIGKCGISADECLTNQQINTIVPHEGVDSKFAYYLLVHNTELVRGVGLGGGAATPILNKTAFSKIKLRVPPRKCWGDIGSILSAYDDLIENNRRRIQLLEQSARLLYKEWFVHLRFPGHEHVTIKDGVPEGWERKQVKEVLGKVKRPRKIKKAEFLEDGPVPCIDQSQAFVGGYTDDEAAVVDEGRPVIVFGDHTRVLKFVDFPFACGADGTQLIVSNDSAMSQEFLYFALDAIDLSNYFYARHFKFLKDQYLPCPSNVLLAQFSDVARPIMKQIKTLRGHVHYLGKARDLLLPRLMNGEIAV